MVSHRGWFSPNDIDLKSVILCLVFIRTKLLLVFMPGSVTVCTSFIMQQGTAGNGTSSDCNLFSKPDCCSSHLSTELSRVRVSCPSVATNHTTDCASKLLHKNLFITLRYMMPMGIVVSGSIAGRHKIILCQRATISHLRGARTMMMAKISHQVRKNIGHCQGWSTASMGKSQLWGTQKWTATCIGTL